MVWFHWTSKGPISGVYDFNAAREKNAQVPGPEGGFQNENGKLISDPEDSRMSQSSRLSR